VKWGGLKVGNAAWIVTTSALLVGLPLMLSIEGEAGIVQQEKDYMGQVSGLTSFVAYEKIPKAGSIIAPITTIAATILRFLNCSSTVQTVDESQTKDFSKRAYEL
jgi:hypothetical protein